MIRLLKRAGRLLRLPSGRLATTECRDRCCNGSACPNYVLVRWCCEPERTAWVYMNRLDCPGHVDWLPTLSATEPQTFKVSADPTSACWTTDPLPEGNVRAYRDIPTGSVIIPLDEASFIVDSCLVPECLNCPECCGSRNMPEGCGDFGPLRCCECGDNYTLTISETMTASGFGTHYADPCTTFPAIGHQQPTWEHQFTHTASFRFECEEVDLGAGPFLRRKVVGQSVITIRRLVHYAVIDYTFPTQAGDPCFLNSASQGRTVVQTDETIVRSWDQLGIGAEGCGLTRSQAARFGPSVGGLGTLGLSKHGVGVGLYDAGDCSGTDATWYAGCSVEAGGDFGTACQFGISRIGSEVQWSGSQGCNAGAFSETGTYVAVGGLPVSTIINGNGPVDSLWTGAEEGTWAYNLQWSTTGGDACQQDPCSKQEPVGLTKTTLKGAKNTGSLAMRVGNGSVLDRALNAKAKDCNCGKR